MAISAISSSVSGMQQAASRFEDSAARVARSGTGLADVDLATEMVNVLMAKTDFTANAKVARTITDMQKSAIDILAQAQSSFDGKRHAVGVASAISMLGWRRDHAQSSHIEFQDRLLLGTLVGILLANGDDLAQDLGVEAVALGLGIDFLDVRGNGRLFLFHALDALDKRPELVLGNALFSHGSYLLKSSAA